MVLEKQVLSIISRIREVVEGGYSLAVIGWRDKNHSLFTRELVKSGKINFYLDVPARLGPTVGLVILTRFVSHADLERLKKGGTQLYPHSLGTGEIKEYLKACGDLFVAVSKQINEKSIPFLVAPSVPMDTSTMLTPAVQSVTRPFAKEKEARMPEVIVKELTPMDKFVKLFIETAETNPKGLVGKMILGRLRKECGINGSNAMLVKGGWIEPVVSPGKTEAGNYRASDKMFKHFEKQEPEPTDPVSRARYLISQEASILAQKEGLEDQVLVLDVELERIKRAKAWLAQAETMF